MSKNLRQLKHELNRLTEAWTFYHDPRVVRVIEEIRAERAPKVAELKAQIEDASI